MTYESKNDHGVLHITNKTVTVKVLLDSYHIEHTVWEIRLWKCTDSYVTFFTKKLVDKIK